MKLKRIGMLMVIGLTITNIVYAKYCCYFEETIIELTRDSNSPICNVIYSIEEETNQNVVVTITANKEIEPVSGFELLEDKKTLQKEVTENENQKITIRDFSGNYTDIEYDVNNIDKEPPIIVGCEDGGVYESPLNLQYYDNKQIKEIKVDQYHEHLIAKAQLTQEEKPKLIVYVKEHPINTVKYRYYLNDEWYSTVTESSYVFPMINQQMEGTIKIEALDKLGNILDTVVIEEIEEKAEEEHVMINENELVESGNYEIEVSDFAGNKSIYHIKVK